MTPKKTKENFCPLCIAPIVALIGAGTAGVGVALTAEEKEAEKKKKRKTWMITIGLSVFLTALMYWVWLKYFKKGGCGESCSVKAPPVGELE